MSEWKGQRMNPVGAWAPAGWEPEALQAKDAVCQGRALCFRHQVEGRPQTLTQPELKFTSKTEDLQCGHGQCEP